MSVHFAIPATTFVLKGVIEARLKLAYGSFTPPPVLVSPPPRPPASPPGGAAEPEAAALILFLHHAGPNAAWRSMYDPHIDASGARIGPAPLVLDLHYMVAALGADLEREILLGVALSALTRNAILPRPMIQAVLASVTIPVTPTRLLDTFTAEPLSNSTSQPEQITLSQAPVDVDYSTKIWSALQSPLRPSAFFLATTVFLDPGETFPAPPIVAEVDVGIRPDPDPAATGALDILAVGDGPS